MGATNEHPHSSILFLIVFCAKRAFMRIRTSKLLLSLSLVAALASCQKEVNFQLDSGSGGGTGGTGGNTTTNIVGDYDFVGLVAHTQSTVTVTDQGQELKSVTVSDYVTKNNTGTVKVTSSELITTNVAYSIDTMMNVKTYIGNLLMSDLDFPFALTAPTTSTSSPYVRNSADSITVTGTFGVSVDPTGNAPTGPVGMKLSWSGDTLLLRVKATFSQTVTQGGVPGTVVGTVDGITKLKKH